MSTSRRHKSKQDFKNLCRANADDTMDVDDGEGAHEHVAGQGGAR